MTDAERLAALLRIKDAVLVAMEAAAGKPDYSIDGQTVSWSSLFKRLQEIDAEIAGIQGPIEVYSEH